MYPYYSSSLGRYDLNYNIETRSRIERLEISIMKMQDKRIPRETYTQNELNNAIDAYLEIEFVPLEWMNKFSYKTGVCQGPISEQISNKDALEKWQSDMKKAEDKNNKPWHTKRQNSRSLWEWITSKPISYTTTKSTPEKLPDKPELVLVELIDYAWSWNYNLDLYQEQTEEMRKFKEDLSELGYEAYLTPVIFSRLSKFLPPARIVLSVAK